MTGSQKPVSLLLKEKATRQPRQKQRCQAPPDSRPEAEAILTGAQTADPQDADNRRWRCGDPHAAPRPLRGDTDTTRVPSAQQELRRPPRRRTQQHAADEGRCSRFPKRGKHARNRPQGAWRVHQRWTWGTFGWSERFMCRRRLRGETRSSSPSVGRLPWCRWKVSRLSIFSHRFQGRRACAPEEAARLHSRGQTRTISPRPGTGLVPLCTRSSTS